MSTKEIFDNLFATAVLKEVETAEENPNAKEYGYGITTIDSNQTTSEKMINNYTHRLIANNDASGAAYAAIFAMIMNDNYSAINIAEDVLIDQKGKDNYTIDDIIEYIMNPENHEILVKNEVIDKYDTGFDMQVSVLHGCYDQEDFEKAKMRHLREIPHRVTYNIKETGSTIGDFNLIDINIHIDWDCVIKIKSERLKQMINTYFECKK